MCNHHSIFSIISYDVISLLKYRSQAPGLEAYGIVLSGLIFSFVMMRKYSPMRIRNKIRTILEEIIIACEISACIFLSFSAINQRKVLDIRYDSFFGDREQLVQIDTSNYETETMFDYNIKLISQLDYVEQEFIVIEDEEKRKDKIREKRKNILLILTTQICYDLGMRDTIPRIEYGDELREAELPGYYDQKKDILLLSAKYIEGSGGDNNKKYSEDIIYTIAYLMYFRSLKYKISLLNYLEENELDKFSWMSMFDEVKAYRDELKHFIPYDESSSEYESNRIVQEAEAFASQTLSTYEERMSAV